MIHFKNQFSFIPRFLYSRQLLFLSWWLRVTSGWQIFQNDRVHLVLWGHKMGSVYQNLWRIIYMVEAMSEFISVKANIKITVSFQVPLLSWKVLQLVNIVMFIDVNFWWIVWVKGGRKIFSIHCTKHPHFSELWRRIYGQNVWSFTVLLITALYMKYKCSFCVVILEVNFPGGKDNCIAIN